MTDLERFVGLLETWAAGREGAPRFPNAQTEADAVRAAIRDVRDVLAQSAQSDAARGLRVDRICPACRCIGSCIPELSREDAIAFGTIIGLIEATEDMATPADLCADHQHKLGILRRVFDESVRTRS